MYLLLPKENIIRKDLFVTELTVLQINMLMIIEEGKCIGKKIDDFQKNS